MCPRIWKDEDDKEDAEGDKEKARGMGAAAFKATGCSIGFGCAESSTLTPTGLHGLTLRLKRLRTASTCREIAIPYEQQKALLTFTPRSCC